MNRTKLAVAVVCSLLLSALAPPPSAQTAVPAGVAETMAEMSLADCLRMGLQNNLDLVVARKDPKIAEQNIIVAGAPFDPVLGASAAFSGTKSDQTISDLVNPTAQELPASQTQQTLGADVSIGQLLKYGGRYDVTLGGNDFSQDGQQVDRVTGFLTGGTIDAKGVSLALKYQMPLLRGFGVEVNTANLILAKSDLEISKEALRAQAHATLIQIENGYWDLLATIEAVKVANESLQLAKDLYDLNKKKVEVGTLAPIEITQAEAGVASREEGVIVAETAVLNAEDNLRRLLAVPKDDPLWQRRIVPVDRPEFRNVTVDVEAAIAKAMEARPEIAAAKKRVENSDLGERVAKNGVRHTLNLTASVTPTEAQSKNRSGVIFPPGLESIANRTDSGGRDWSVGLVYGYPIGNRSAKANYAIAKLNLEKTEIGLQSVEQDVRVDVRTAARTVESNVKRVEAARSSTALQRKTLEAEQKKFENGMSTSFEVLRIQTDLSSAQVAQIRAVLDYIKSLADLERAKGTLLEARGLTLDESAGK